MQSSLSAYNYFKKWGGVLCLKLYPCNKLERANHSALCEYSFLFEIIFLKFPTIYQNQKIKSPNRVRCNVGASKNAGQAFSTQRLSLHLARLGGLIFVCFNNYLARASSSSHFLSTSAWILPMSSSFPGLKRCLNRPCGRKKSSIGSFFFGT